MAAVCLDPGVAAAPPSPAPAVAVVGRQGQGLVVPPPAPVAVLIQNTCTEICQAATGLSLQRRR